MKFARDAREPAFAPRTEFTAPDLEALLALDEPQWRALTVGTALRRPKRAGILRNVLIALANRGDRAAVPAVTRALDDPEPLVRAEAARCLARLGVAPPA